MTSVPSNYRLVYSADDIRSGITTVGKQIDQWASSSSDSVLAICVLRGAVFFFADLLRAIPTSVEPAFCRTWSYSSRTNQQFDHAVRVNVDDVVAEQKRILLIDDICDSGRTLAKLKNVFSELGASEVKAVTLIRREIDNPHYHPDWSVFTHRGDEWFVGYGMEDRNQHANLPEVYCIDRE